MAARSEEFSRVVDTVNLHRIWWIVLVSTGLNLAFLGFNFLSPILRDERLALWQSIDVLVSLGLLVAIRVLRKTSAAHLWRRRMVVVFTLLVLGFMDVYYFILLRLHGHTSVYVLGVIAVGVLVLLPPRTFLAIFLVNHVIFCACLLAAAPARKVVVSGILDGSSAVLIASLAGWFLYRARWNDFQQRRTIAERNRDLERGNEEMAQVMAITAHDLRSPLQGVKHLLDFVRQSAGPEHWASVLTTASQSCGEMLTLIARLLDAHVAEGKAGRVERSRQDLREIFVASAERARALATGKAIRIDFVPPSDVALAWIDPGALAQVLSNLLANAIKFSPSGSIVTLRLWGEGRRWCGEVCDQGQGVPEAARTDLFRKFHRGREAGENSGHGLGLFIVRRLMTAMGGSVEYVSRGESGAAFRLEFPVAPMGLEESVDWPRMGPS